MKLKYLDHSFFSNGLTEVIFSHSGKIPDLKEQLTRSNCTESKVFISKSSFQQKVSFIFFMKLNICSIVTGASTYMVFKEDLESKKYIQNYGNF